MTLTVEQVANLYNDIAEKVMTFQNAVSKLLDIEITNETRLEDMKRMVDQMENEAVEYVFTRFLEVYDSFKRLELIYVEVDNGLEKYVRKK